MKVYVAILAIVLLQGVAVNCQSSLTMDDVMNGINSAYRYYRSGQLTDNLRQLIGSTKSFLNRIQGALNTPSVGSGRTFSLPSISLPSFTTTTTTTTTTPRPNWPWVQIQQGIQQALAQ